MMNVKLLILCEGSTDQVLIGSYIENTSNWKFVRDIKNNPFPENEIAWYSDETGQYIGLWNNGGNDFTNTVSVVCKRELIDHLVEKLMIVTDHDDESAECDRPEKISEVIEHSLNCTLQNRTLINKWQRVSFTNDLNGAPFFDYGYLLVPLDSQGALETYMLNSLSENNDDAKAVVNKANRFVDDFISEAYLRSRRDRIKAKLGVSMSVFDPDKSLHNMLEIIKSVDWNGFETSNKQFELIDEVVHKM